MTPSRLEVTVRVTLLATWCDTLNRAARSFSTRRSASATLVLITMPGACEPPGVACSRFQASLRRVSKLRMLSELKRVLT